MESPSWVTSVRSGESSLVIKNGTSSLYRRIAANCEQAVKLAEKDIRKNQGKVAYKVEHLYKDNDCAVTLSTNASEKALKRSLSKAELAEEHAVSGYTELEFERLTGIAVPVLDIDYRNRCWQNFYKSGAAYHGSTTVCWLNGTIVGYCLEEGCYTKD